MVISPWRVDAPKAPKAARLLAFFIKRLSSVFTEISILVNLSAGLFHFYCLFFIRRTKQTYQHRRHTLNILDESLRSHANTFVLDTKVVVNGWIDSLAVDVLNGGRRKSVTIQPYIMFAIQDL